MRDSFLSADSAPEPDPEPDPNWMQAGSEPASGQLSSQVRSRGRCRISCRIPSFRWIQLRNRIQNRIEPDPSRIRTGLGTVFFANQVQGALADQLPDSFLSADSAPEPDPEPDPNRIQAGSEPASGQFSSRIRSSGPVFFAGGFSWILVDSGGI